MAVHSRPPLFGDTPEAGPAGATRDCGQIRPFVRRAGVFLLVGLIIYLAVYAVAEHLVYRHTERNRFFMIRSAPPARYDYVILGTSHAVALGHGDLNAKLEEMTGARVMNLSVVGGGVVVNRLLLDYFLTRHQAATIVYVVDSFAFYSRQWNEDRLQDSSLFIRAPLDMRLAGLLLRTPGGRGMALDYVAGFSKINNPNRFAPDVSNEERNRVMRVYRPVPQIDRQRMDYLYPETTEPATIRGYVSELESLIAHAQSQEIRVVVIKPPLPERVIRMMPDEGTFDSILQPALRRHCVDLHDFSAVGNDDAFFYDTDHLNRAGVLNFFQVLVSEALTEGAAPTPCDASAAGVL